MDHSPVISKNLVALARMLERLERRTTPVDADQFRTVIDRLKAELAAATHDAALEVVLATFPSTAELYENMQYEHAGLCRTPLDAAAAAEIEARRVIDTARGAPKAA
jgi:hypothetical protein